MGGWGDITIYKLPTMAWYRALVPYTISSGPLRTARTAARATDRPNHFGRLPSYSTVYSDSTYIQGTWDTTGYMWEVCTGGGIIYQHREVRVGGAALESRALGGRR